MSVRERALEAQLMDAKKDAADWKREWEMYRDAWIRELGGNVMRKTHLIDALVLTTRKMREDALAFARQNGDKRNG